MDAFNKVISTVSEAFVFNQATLSGSVDIIVVKQKDGSYKGTGFHARFGKVHAIKSKERIVRIEINGAPTNVTMKLGDGGEAYFEEKVINSAENESSDDSLQSENSSLDNILSNSTNNLESKISRNKIQIINNAESDQVKVERLVSSRVTDHTTGLCRSDNKEEKENELYIDSDKENRNASSLIDINALIKENGMTSRDIEIADKIIHQISADLTIKIALYNESTIGLTSEQTDSIFQKYLVPWQEFVEKPQNYIRNNTLVISVNNTIFEHKIASYILANLVNSLKNTVNSNSAKISPELVAKVQVQSESETSMLSSTNRVNSPKSLQSDKTSRVRKCLRLSSEKIKLLNLRPGQNTITYIINTGLQGTQKLQANIYLWSYNTKLIVTDVDGTITKSDFLGAILPILGKDWTQPGIAPLFANIHRNGYQILYLTSRAIGQIGFTRDFVKSVHQDGKNLPQGPIISSPDQLLSCFKREIVFSKPEFFKSAALRDIRNLFPADHNPFHAGFGNRENDAVAYRYVGIPLENIFTVNGNGEVHHAAHTLYKSYAYLNAKVKEVFPCIHLKSH